LPALRCSGLTQRFGETVAVDALDLEVPKVRCRATRPQRRRQDDHDPHDHHVVVRAPGRDQRFGVDVASRRMAVRRLIGYVPQQLSADATLTGRENVALFARLYDVPRRNRAARVADVLAEVGLSEVADRPAKTYSGGMVRRWSSRRRWSAPPAARARRTDRRPRPGARASVWARIEQIKQATG